LNNSINSVKDESVTYIYELLKSIRPVFASNTSISNLANNLYIILKDDGYNDYQIKNGKCNSKIFEYLTQTNLGFKFSDEYREALSRVLRVLNDSLADGIKQSDIYDKGYFTYNSHPSSKVRLCFEIISQALNDGYTLEDFKTHNFTNYIYNFVNFDRARMKSTSKEIERSKAGKHESKKVPDELKRGFFIGLAIFYGVAAISKYVYETNQAKKSREEENNKTRKSHYSYVGNMRSEKDMIKIAETRYYDYQNNSIVEMGESHGRN